MLYQLSTESEAKCQIWGQTRNPMLGIQSDAYTEILIPNRDIDTESKISIPGYNTQSWIRYQIQDGIQNPKLKLTYRT